jgi:hypothetical protein
MSSEALKTDPREQTTTYRPRVLSMRILAMLEPQNVPQLKAR